MTDVDRFVVGPLENLLGSLPLGNYPAGRVIYGAALGAAIVFGLKPSLMFDKPSDQPRPWIITDPEGKNPTAFPWPAGLLIPAFVLGVLI